MKIIYNNLIPFPGYAAMMFFGVIFARKSAKPLSATIINHEAIHKAQVVEDFKKKGEKRNWKAWLRYYIAYLVQWIKYGYRNIPFEREAYDNEGDSAYLSRRERFAWKRYETI